MGLCVWEGTKEPHSMQSKGSRTPITLFLAASPTIFIERLLGVMKGWGFKEAIASL